MLENKNHSQISRTFCQALAGVGVAAMKKTPTLPLLRKVRCPPRGPLFILGRPGDEKSPQAAGLAEIWTEALTRLPFYGRTSLQLSPLFFSS